MNIAHLFQRTENFINASDEFYTYLAEFIRAEIKSKPTDIDKLRELSEIVKINSASIKSQKEETKMSKSPLEKIKGRSNGQAVA